jgi:hypothetical protein
MNISESYVASGRFVSVVITGVLEHTKVPQVPIGKLRYLGSYIIADGRTFITNVIKIYDAHT